MARRPETGRSVSRAKAPGAAIRLRPLVTHSRPSVRRAAATTSRRPARPWSASASASAIGSARFGPITVRGVVEAGPDRSASMVELVRRVVGAETLEGAGCCRSADACASQVVKLTPALAARRAREDLARRISDTGGRDLLRRGAARTAEVSRSSTVSRCRARSRLVGAAAVARRWRPSESPAGDHRDPQGAGADSRRARQFSSRRRRSGVPAASSGLARGGPADGTHRRPRRVRPFTGAAGHVLNPRAG